VVRLYLLLEQILFQTDVQNLPRCVKLKEGEMLCKVRVLKCFRYCTPTHSVAFVAMVKLGSVILGNYFNLKLCNWFGLLP
jgi:hypothetical protein